MGRWGHENVIAWGAGQEGRRDTNIEHLQEIYLTLSYDSVAIFRICRYILDYVTLYLVFEFGNFRLSVRRLLDFNFDASTFASSTTWKIILRIKDKSTISRDASSLHTLSTYPQ